MGLHAAHLWLDFGVFAVLCATAALPVNVSASQANRAGKGRLPKVEGINRAQRRKERAEFGRRRR